MPSRKSDQRRSDVPAAKETTAEQDSSMIVDSAPLESDTPADATMPPPPTHAGTASSEAGPEKKEKEKDKDRDTVTIEVSHLRNAPFLPLFSSLGMAIQSGN